MLPELSVKVEKYQKTLLIDGRETDIIWPNLEDIRPLHGLAVKFEILKETTAKLQQLCNLSPEDKAEFIGFMQKNM